GILVYCDRVMQAGHSIHEGELQRFRTLYRLLADLTKAEDLEQILDAAITSLLEATDADRASILMFDDDGVMRFKAWRGLSAEYREAVTGHTPWRRGARDAEVIVVPDVHADRSMAAYAYLFAREQIGALAFIPLNASDGVFGKFMLYYRD